MRKIIKKILPDKVILFYHYALAVLAAFSYDWPSRKMIVIGVTGTKGKTSTINFIWSCLMAGGYKTGIITTANIRIGKEESLNKYHMTMPGPFIIQKAISQMQKSGCKVCVIETTSEGLKQFRDYGIYYDIAIFTNLSPEHLFSHGGSFDNYRATKGKMFEALWPYIKIIDGKKIDKFTIVNKDSRDADYFLSFRSDRKITYATEKDADLRAKNIKESRDGVDFTLDGKPYSLSVLGKFNVYNALPAIAIAQIFSINEGQIKKGLSSLSVIPGRMERIDLGQDFTVIVDYAHEKQSMTKLLESANKLKNEGSKTIVLLGAEGGGRDKSKRPIMGEIAAKMADYVIVCNVDPYDDDPKEILEDIAKSSEKIGKKRDEDLFVIEDRREGIRKALSLAGRGDIVLITGKGAEQSMIIKSKKIPWDDRHVVEEELKKLTKQK